MNKSYKEKIEEYRESIDRLDSVLIYTLGERFEKTKKPLKACMNFHLRVSQRHLKSELRSFFSALHQS